MTEYCPTFCGKCQQCLASMAEDAALDVAMGEAMVGPPTIYDAAFRLVKVAWRVCKELGPQHPLYAQLTEAAADVEAFDQTDDPRQNGWVGSDGRP